MYFKLCKEYTNQTFAAIGKTLNKDHATVMHGVKVFDSFRTWEETKYLEAYETLSNIIKQQANPNSLPKDVFIQRLLHDKINLKQQNQQLTNKLKNIY